MYFVIGGLKEQHVVTKQWEENRFLSGFHNLPQGNLSQNIVRIQAIS
jgi:hypothetical protein